MASARHFSPASPFVYSRVPEMKSVEQTGVVLECGGTI